MAWHQAVYGRKIDKERESEREEKGRKRKARKKKGRGKMYLEIKDSMIEYFA